MSFGMATGPVTGRSPARQCADANDLTTSPGPEGPGLVCCDRPPEQIRRRPMVVVMAPEATQQDVDAVVDLVRAAGGAAFVSRGVSRTIVGLVGDVEQFGPDTLTVIAGPCAVESHEQTLTAARMAKAAGASLLRGGAFKPRTSPYAYQGLGEAGLRILADIRA